MFLSSLRISNWSGPFVILSFIKHKLNRRNFIHWSYGIFLASFIQLTMCKLVPAIKVIPVITHGGKRQLRWETLNDLKFIPSPKQELNAARPCHEIDERQMLALPLMIIAKLNKSHSQSWRFFFRFRQNKRIPHIKTHSIPVPFLFLGKPATLSTSHSLYLAAYATDGDVNTFFHTNGPEIGGWLRVDLQTTHCIQGVNLINRNLQQGTYK